MRRLRRLIVIASLVAAPLAVIVAGPADATCDPRKPSTCRPVCIIDEPVRFPTNCM